MLEYNIIKIATTGLDLENDDITQITILRIKETEVVDKFKAYVRPKCPISEEAVKISGITNKMVENACEFKDMKDAVVSFLGERPIVGFSKFEKTFLEKYGIVYNVVDLREITRNHGYGSLKSAYDFYTNHEVYSPLKTTEQKALAIKAILESILKWLKK